MRGDPRLTRRAVLVGSLAAAISACRPRRRANGPALQPQASADADALGQAIADEEQLLLTLSRLAAVGDVREKEQGVHADHLVALRQALGGTGRTSATSSPAAPSDSPPAEHKRNLQRRFERQRGASARRLRALALTAAHGSDAALLASIAGCHSAPEAWDGGQFFGGQFFGSRQ